MHFTCFFYFFFVATRNFQLHMWLTFAACTLSLLDIAGPHRNEHTHTCLCVCAHVHSHVWEHNIICVLHLSFSTFLSNMSMLGKYFPSLHKENFKKLTYGSVV